MSFTLEIKREIIEREFSPDQAFDFIRGIIASSGIQKNNKTHIRISSAEMSHHISNILLALEISSSKSIENKNFIIIDSLVKDQNVKFPDWFFAGLFIGGGSVSDKESTSYHLEIQFHQHEHAIRLRNYFAKYDFSFNIIQRRKKWVLYLKKQVEISDFLKSIHASSSSLLFEEARIQRDLYNVLNRYSNLDTYNQSKLAWASNNFKVTYNDAKTLNLLHVFSEKENNFFKMKIKNQYTSLADLAVMYNNKYKTKKTRAGLNHWIYKLKRIVNENSQESNVRSD